MAEKKHKRLLTQEQFNALDPNVKDRAVQLNGGYYIIYPFKLAEDKFKIKADAKNEKESLQVRKRDEASKALGEELTGNDFKKSNEELNKFVLNGSSVLDKDWRLFAKASPEMDWVKKSMHALNSVLSENLSEYLKNGVFDSDAYQKRLETAYDEFIMAADNYVKTKNPGSRPGKRRKRQVAALLRRVKQMKLASKSVVTSIKDGAVDFANMAPEKLNKLNSTNAVSEIASEEVDIDMKVEWQNEGNSTDVYKIYLKGSDGKAYYLKENLPFLSENIAGFLSRRYSQLKTSNDNRIENLKNPTAEKKPVEERLNKITENDYKNGMTLLKNLSDGLQKASDEDRVELEGRISGYFAHNFDDIFKRLKLNNLVAGFGEDERGLSLPEQIAKAKREGDVLKEAALEYKLSVLKNDKNYNAEGGVAKEFKQMSAKEWLKKELQLDDSKDKIFLETLGKMKDDEIETLFRVTMGKEVELFGQMSAEKKQDSSDIAAINNTATSRVAEHLGFDDVIVKSRTALVKFPRRDGTVVNQLCTLSEEAPGTELVDLMKEAERDGKKIVYSSEAIRNLVRLQMIDTLTLQKDRHGRNFKCKVERDEKTKTITIESVKAYDNDMSFDALSLADAFNAGKANELKSLNFLPNMNTKIEKDSALYKHILGTYFGIDVVSKPKEPETPSIRFGSVNVRIKKEHLGHGAFTIWKGNHFKDAEDVKSLRFNVVGIDGITFRDEPHNAPKKEEEAAIKAEMEKMGIEIDEKDPMDSYQNYAMQKFLNLNNQIKRIWAVDDETLKNVKKSKMVEEGLRKDLSIEEQKKLAVLIKELKELNEKFDFSTVRQDHMDYVPIVDIYIKSMVFLHDVAYGDTLDNRIKRSDNYESISSLMDDHGNLVIPTMLHYDKEAFDKLQASVAEYRDKNSLAVHRLRELGLSDEKIEALAKRNEEQVNHIINAREKAEAFYKAAGWKLPDPRAKFLLEKEDYKKIGKLTDFAVDPGKTYLAVDNENFLVGQKFKMNVDGKETVVDYKSLMSENEKKEAEKYNDEIKNDEKRWKYTEQDKMKKIFDKNCVGDVSADSFDPKAYIRSCALDEIYNISHKPIANENELSQKVWKVLFINSLHNKTDEKGNPLSLNDVKKLIDKPVDARATFDELLSKKPASIYKQKIDNAITNLFNDEKHPYKQFDSASFFKMNKEALKQTMTDVLNGMTKENPDPEKIAKYLRETENLAKQCGVELSAEKSFNDFVKDKPGISEELKNSIKNAGLKPEAKKVKKEDVKEVNKNNNKEVGKGKKNENQGPKVKK